MRKSHCSPERLQPLWRGVTESTQTKFFSGASSFAKVDSRAILLPPNSFRFVSPKSVKRIPCQFKVPFMSNWGVCVFASKVQSMPERFASFWSS